VQSIWWTKKTTEKVKKKYGIARSLALFPGFSLQGACDRILHWENKEKRAKLSAAISYK
jgi:hypothetical protein